MSVADFGARPTWEPTRPRLRPLRLLIAWVLSGAAVYVAAGLVPGIEIGSPGGALLAAASIAVVNALLPPVIAALRLPFTLLAGFLLVLLADAAALVIVDDLFPEALRVDGFGDALLGSIVIAGTSIALQVLTSTNDDDEYNLRVVRRVARRQGAIASGSAPGIIFLEIDGLALPVLQAAMRDGSAPNLARWLSEDDYRLTEWETDLSSQTGASQAGILLGSNEDIPAFRWVEKETGRVMACSNPADCEEIERRRSTGRGLLADGGASRGNLLSGDAEAVILTVSRIDAEKGVNPGYRAFFANGFNVTRSLALFVWEVLLEWVAATRAKRRDVRPRGHRGGSYPFLRAGMCVVVRDLVVFGVLNDMMRGRPAVYATFASYDEVAHHSGLQQADTLEALRKLDQQFGRIAAARRYAPRPYEIVVLSDHGQTQGATFKQRNGYGLDELVESTLADGEVTVLAGGDEQEAMLTLAVKEASRGSGGSDAAGDPLPERPTILGSGNLGLIYLPGSDRRLKLEEIEHAHPGLIQTLRSHPHIGWLLVESAEHGPLVLGAEGERRLRDDVVLGDDPLAPFSDRAPQHVLRSSGFEHAPDLMLGSFYDPALDEGCAFEELISFHGGLGGPQTRPFIMHPAELEVGDQPIVGAEEVHRILVRWRSELNSRPA